MTRSGEDDGLRDVEFWNLEDEQELKHSERPSDYSITVASRDWTVDTMVRQIEQGNIDLDPAFQRRNAWQDSRRSRLVESFVLGFPVPQVVLAEHPKEARRFIVIDGKQRLMTVAGLYLPEYRKYWKKAAFTGLKVLSRLNRVPLDDLLMSRRFAALKRQLDNADIRTTVITGFRNEDVLYDIFFRINTGTVPLSAQELRQVLNRGAFAQLLLEITNESNPLWRVLNIKAPDARLRDVELLLRLIAWRKFSQHYPGSMKIFLDTTMEMLNAHWGEASSELEGDVIRTLEGVEAAAEVFGAALGRKYRRGRFEGRLNRAVFEVQAHYLSFPRVADAARRRKTAVREHARLIFDQEDFTSSVESTTKSIENCRIRFGEYRNMLSQVLSMQIPMLRLPRER